MIVKKPSDICRSFSMAFLSEVVGVLSEASGSAWVVDAVPAPTPGLNDLRVIYVAVSLGGSLRAEMSLEFMHTAAIVIAAKFTMRPSDQLEGDLAEHLRRLTESAMNVFSRSHADKYGVFTGTVAVRSQTVPDRSKGAYWSLCDADGSCASVSAYLSDALAEALYLQSEARDFAARAGLLAEEKSGNTSQDQVNLDLVMGVELNVTLRFGQRQLTLREVLELTSGSVVELDRQVEEPVELLLEGKVIARGEAVVIDGNYGLRITEVSQ
jgi:flagellar motor switch protein FliN/FliY